MFDLLPFQQIAVDSLTEVFLKAWSLEARNTPVLLKAPTGSGKTLITCSFINRLNSLPNWNQDKAFIWVTFSDDLAMQSRTKFAEYFENNLENELLTVSDIDRRKLFYNDILFLNWQKVVSRSAKNRVLRRPEGEMMRKEAGTYFEDYIEKTHDDDREIVLVIDESHTHVTTQLAQEIIAKINPNVTLHVTATPGADIELEAYRASTVVEIERSDVVAEGLIKEKIVTQTEEDLRSLGTQDLDEALLELSLQKYEEVKENYRLLGKDINPLVMIQLPNDDNRLVELGHPTKEDITLQYLKKKGIQDHQIALWFDGRKKNYDETIKLNRSEVSFLLFKQAAGTGWDCPRAHILVMFREINSTTFYVQTVGRILRMAEPGKLEEYLSYPTLCTGYLFTNYKRDEIRGREEYKKDDLRDLLATRKDNLTNISLESDFIARIDYGDLGSSAKFQISFVDSMNKWLGVKNAILSQGKDSLSKKGLNLEPKITYQIVADAEFKDFDKITLEFSKSGDNYDVEMSRSDTEKAFNLACYDFLAEQTEEESKIGNIARSWSPFKSAVRVWLKGVLPEAEGNPNLLYKVVLSDLLKGSNSMLRPAFSQALKNYRPIREEVLKQREDRRHPKIEFRIQDYYSFTDEYEILAQSKCVLDKFYIKKEYVGKINEVAFVEFLEVLGDKLQWWFKNHDYGKEHYALKYFNTKTGTNKLFYPDWIVLLNDGRIGIFDTKSGDTAEDTEGRAEALADKLAELGDKYVGGITVKENNVWYVNSSNKYSYTRGKLNSDWVELTKIFN